MPKESQTWINLKNQISIEQVSSRKLKNQISKFNKVLKQSVKCQAEELKNQISKVNKVSKQSVKANFPSLIWWTASTLKWWGRNYSILKRDWDCHYNPAFDTEWLELFNIKGKFFVLLTILKVMSSHHWGKGKLFNIKGKFFVLLTILKVMSSHHWIW